MRAKTKFKQFLLTRVPGIKNIRDIRNKFIYQSKIEARLSRLEDFLLPTLTAQLLKRLAPFESPSIKLIRVGNKADGGYVMGDVFDKVDAAYSLGIANDITWDKEIAQRSIPVYMYDHTINYLPEEHKNFKFFKIGICGKPGILGMKDIGTLIKENGHTGKNLLLKMDIEGFEYPALQALSDEEIAHFSQICMEIHDLNGLLFDVERHFEIRSCLEKILRHMHCVHIHANNVGWIAERGGISVPVLLEVSFIRKDLVGDFRRADYLQTELDEPNNPDLPEIDVHYIWSQEANGMVQP